MTQQEKELKQTATNILIEQGLELTKETLPFLYHKGMTERHQYIAFVLTHRTVKGLLEQTVKALEGYKTTIEIGEVSVELMKINQIITEAKKSYDEQMEKMK